MKIHHLSVDEAFTSMQSAPGGLDAAEAQRRLAEFGPNQIERVGGESAAWMLLKEFGHFFAIILDRRGAGVLRRSA